MKDLSPRLILEYASDVAYRGRRYVICQQPSDFSAISIKDPESGAIFQAAVAELSPYVEKSKASPGDLATIPEKRAAEANYKYEVIKPLLNMAKRTSADVVAQATKYGLSRSAVYQWLQEFDRIGKVSVFVRKTRKDAGKKKIPKQLEDIISDAIKTQYLTKQKKKPSAVIIEIERICKKLEIDPPHPNTVRSRVRQINAYEKKKNREGNKAARDAYAPHKSEFPGADFPLSVVQVDHTPLDIILVDDAHRQPIGRPWLTLLIDVYSRMILGFYISFDPPGNLSLGLCLTHAFLPKENWLAKHNIDTPWPCWGTPRTIHADNAKEFRGNMLQQACKEYGIDLEWRPVATPHYGAHIERLLGTLNREIHNAPGTTFSNLKERGEYDSDKESAMTLTEFERWLAILCVEVYHQRPHSQLGMPPIAKWQEGILGTKISPGTGLPPRITDELRLKLDLMPFDTRTVQHYGIVWDHIQYQHDVLRRWVNATDPNSPKNKRQFLCRRDPRDISVIWFYDPELEDYFAIPYRNTSRPAISLWELRAAEHRAKQERPDFPIEEDLIFQAYDKLREIEDNAKTMTKKVRRSRERSRVGINNARAHIPPVSPKAEPHPSQNKAPPARVIKPFEDIDDMQGDDDD